eukprot:gene11406-13477_t
MLFVADTGNNCIRAVSSSANVQTLAGSGTKGFQDGLGTMAKFSRPTGLASHPTDPTKLYVTDTANAKVRLIRSQRHSHQGEAAQVTSLWVNGTVRLNAPFDSVITSDGLVLYVSDREAQCIRRVSLETGIVTTLAGLMSDAEHSHLHNPVNVMKDTGTGLTKEDTEHTVRHTTSHLHDMLLEAHHRRLAPKDPGPKSLLLIMWWAVFTGTCLGVTIAAVVLLVLWWQYYGRSTMQRLRQVSTEAEVDVYAEDSPKKEPAPVSYSTNLEEYQQGGWLLGMMWPLAKRLLGHGRRVVIWGYVRLSPLVKGAAAQLARLMRQMSGLTGRTAWRLVAGSAQALISAVRAAFPAHMWERVKDAMEWMEQRGGLAGKVVISTGCEPF